MARLPVLDVPIVDYGDDEEAMIRYRREGEARAAALGNRGPITFDERRRIDHSILDAYEEHGFYVFTGVVTPEELDDIERDVIDLLDRAPVVKGADVDRHGRPALGADGRSQNILWVRPLSDPWGGTSAANGRHPSKMIEPQPPQEAPEHVVQLIGGSLQFSPACLRLYGHPQLLAVAAAINGDDFVPFNEAVWIKQAGLGASVAWHQDGWTHWDSPGLDSGSHGFNFMAQLYGCTSANGLWVVPGSHRRGKVDIKAMVDAAGSTACPTRCPSCAPRATWRSPTARPCTARSPTPARCHGSRSTSGSTAGARVLGVESGGVHNAVAVYDEARVHERSKAIAYAIDARAQRFPDEPRFTYRPFNGLEDEHRWTPATMDALRDDNLLDLGI